MHSLILAAALLTQADTPPETNWHKYFQSLAEEYSLTTADAAKAQCVLRKTPILRWNQPVRGGDSGCMYVWLREGRPAAVGTIFAWPMGDGRRGITHEFHSLDSVPLSASRGQLHWSPEKAGVTFAPLADAATPAATEPQRLVQMRMLTRRFSAISIDKDNKEWQLRTLPQPLYRYEPQGSKDVIDGAIFAAAQGTDPEVLLLLEARREGNTTVWKYALGRFSDLKLRVSLDNKQVWSVENSIQNDVKGVYWCTTAEILASPPEDAPAKKP